MDEFGEFINIIFNLSSFLRINELSIKWIVHIKITLIEFKTDVNKTVNLYILNRIGVLWSSLLPLLVSAWVIKL